MPLNYRMATDLVRCLHHLIPQGKARSDMTVEERIGAADRRKMDGNALFKEEKLEEAMQQYEMVTHLLLITLLLSLLHFMVNKN